MQYHVVDEFGQPWTLGPSDLLYAQAEAGQAQFKIADIVEQHGNGYGWWTPVRAQTEWLARHDFTNEPVDHERLSNMDLVTKIEESSGYLFHLEATLGILRGRLTAINETYEAGVMIRHGERPDVARVRYESKVIHDDERFRYMRRLIAELKTVIETAEGYRNAYRARYDALSRVVTVRQLEAQLSK